MAWHSEFSQIFVAAAALLVLLAGMVAFCPPPATELAQVRHATRKLWPAQSYIEEARHTTRSAVEGPGVLDGLKETRENVLGTLDSLRRARMGMLRMFPGKEWPGAAAERAAAERMGKARPVPLRATAGLPVGPERSAPQSKARKESAGQAIGVAKRSAPRHNVEEPLSTAMGSLYRVVNNRENVLGSLSGDGKDRNTPGGLFAVRMATPFPKAAAALDKKRRESGHYEADGLHWVVESARARSSRGRSGGAVADSHSHDAGDGRQALTLRALEAEVGAAQAQRRRAASVEAARLGLDSALRGGQTLTAGALSLRRVLSNLGWASAAAAASVPAARPSRQSAAIRLRASGAVASAAGGRGAAGFGDFAAGEESARGGAGSRRTGTLEGKRDGFGLADIFGDEQKRVVSLWPGRRGQGVRLDGAMGVREGGGS